MVPGPIKHLRGHGLRALLVLSAVALAVASGALVISVASNHKSAEGSTHEAARHAPASTTSEPTTTTVPSPPTVPDYGPYSVAAANVNVKSLPVYPWPGAANPGLELPNPNNLGAPLYLLVASVQGQWVQTYLPVRPNESEGWVPLSDVTISSDPYHITISVAARLLTVYQGQTSLYQAPVAVGAPDSPTPLGDFFVVDVLKLTDPQDAYGPYALGLSGFSNTYYSFDGGPGEIAVHGTNQPWVIGGYASHGCVRLANPDITKVAQLVPPGTPVDIGL